MVRVANIELEVIEVQTAVFVFIEDIIQNAHPDYLFFPLVADNLMQSSLFEVKLVTVVLVIVVCSKEEVLNLKISVGAEVEVY